MFPILAALAASGCSGGLTLDPPNQTGSVERPETARSSAAGTALAGATAAALSADKIAAVAEAARQMTGDKDATVGSLRAMAFQDAPGTHVCGYASTSKDPSIPLYVELRHKDGTFSAERGQIGATPANLAKVRFMCRNHGEW